MVNQSMSDIHESTTCRLGADGGPCDLCATANESAAQDRVALRADMARDRQFASLTVVRAAVADVLDGKDACSFPGCGLHGWRFERNDESDEETEHRGRFIDAICARITTLQAPPFNFDAGLRERLTETTEEGTDCD